MSKQDRMSQQWPFLFEPNVQQLAAGDALISGVAGRGEQIYEQILYDPILEDVPEYRETVRKSLEERGMDARQVHRLLLSANEIFANLTEHPAEKPDMIRTVISLHECGVMMEIFDNSTPFVDFIGKRAESLKKIEDRNLSLRGRGLGIVSRLHPGHAYVPGVAGSRGADGLNRFTILDCSVSGTVQKHESPDISTRQSQVVVRARDEDAKQKPHRPLVFVVDDAKTIRTTMNVLLRDKYEVFLFSSGFDALAAFEVRRPDIIISDMQMPGMTGIELRKALSALDGGDITPFIFISGNRAETLQEMASNLGIDDFIYKPIRRQRLLNVIERLLRRSRQLHEGLNGRFASDVTMHLKPDLPRRIGAWQVELRNTMAEAGGGDFVLHKNEDNGNALILADVMGHGLEAKFFSYAYAGYLRSLFRLFPIGHRPGDFLDKLSAAVADDRLLDAVLMTCVAVSFDDEGTVIMATSGHPPPYHVSRCSGQVAAVPISGPLPGIALSQTYAEEALSLQPGDRLVLYTDGLFECRQNNHKKSAIHESLRSSISAYAEQPLEVFTNSLWATARQKQQKDKFEDDSTLITLEYAPGRN